MSEEPKPPSWWQTIPGILTAIGGTATALAALIVTLTAAWQQVAGVFQNKTEPQVSRNSQAKNEPVVLPLDLCKKLSGLSIYFNGNNYHGVVGPAGIPLQQIGDRFQFETNVVFSKETNREFSREINDKIVGGTCQDKTIRFTRKLSDGSSHRHSGTISEGPAGAINLEGTFLDENDKQYYWSGRVGDPIP